jgi:hypothetical protein
MRFRVQVLDALTYVVRKSTLDTRNAVTALECIRTIEWRPRAVTMRVLDADAGIVQSEAKASKT